MITRLLTLFSLLFVAMHAYAIEPVYSSWGKAIKAYDTVAYFTESKPVKGDKQFTHDWNGATWYFSSQENLDLFKADAEKYAPQYGGYCAYAVSKGSTAKIDPEAWAIVYGKLYLNYNLKIKKRWDEDRAEHIESADSNWPKLLAK